MSLKPKFSTRCFTKISVDNKAKLHSLLKRQAKQDVEAKRKKRFDFWSSAIFIGAMLLLVWAIEIYHTTFIDWKILGGPIMTGGFFGTLLSWRTLFKFSYPVWATLMIGFGTGSSLFYFSFLFANEKFANTTQTTEIFAIEKTGRFASGRSGCGKPYAVINFYGLSKDIVFSCDDNDRINDYSNLRITYSKGLIGYYIIRKKSLE